MIGQTKYYLGAGSTAVGASYIYTWERGTVSYSGYSTNWIGNIGLMHQSDCAYTYSF